MITLGFCIQKTTVERKMEVRGVGKLRLKN
jgi:hypothetical protein